MFSQFALLLPLVTALAARADAAARKATSSGITLLLFNDLDRECALHCL